MTFPISAEGGVGLGRCRDRRRVNVRTWLSYAEYRYLVEV